jgi:hypothetical protein
MKEMIRRVTLLVLNEKQINDFKEYVKKVTSCDDEETEKMVKVVSEVVKKQYKYAGELMQNVYDECAKLDIVCGTLAIYFRASTLLDIDCEKLLEEREHNEDSNDKR